MLRFFKSKSKLEKLQKQYEKLMSEWHQLSSVDRSKSDKKYAEAQDILNQIEILRQD